MQNTRVLSFIAVGCCDFDSCDHCRDSATFSEFARALGRRINESIMIPLNMICPKNPGPKQHVPIGVLRVRTPVKVLGPTPAIERIDNFCKSERVLHKESEFPWDGILHLQPYLRFGMTGPEHGTHPSPTELQKLLYTWSPREYFLDRYFCCL